MTIKFKNLNKTIIKCKKCPRLVKFIKKITTKKRRQNINETYWGKPVTGFGDHNAKILILGLAPAAHGGTRTGRAFTGDKSGDFLFKCLYEAQVANQPISTNLDDGLKLKSTYITNILKCVPPEDKPLSKEIHNCSVFLHNEINNLPKTKKINKKINNNVIVPKKNLSIDRICYKYPNSSLTALRDINLNINVNTTVGIVGATGSGKTTMVDILLGLLEAQEGSLKVDGKLINRHNLRSWQSSIGYVPQNTFLADDTISANIAFGVNLKDINQNDVEEAAKIANLHEFVSNELPLKYQTVVGERGVRLSGGQIQRIGISRALYKKPQLLILDEATSSLDNFTEKAVMDALANLHKKITIVKIAHRLSTIKECDEIFFLENGELKAKGTYQELVEKSDCFNRMASLSSFNN